MRSVATLQAVDSGTMIFDGIDIAKEPDRLRDVLGYLPQDFGVYRRSPRGTCSITSRSSKAEQAQGAARGGQGAAPPHHLWEHSSRRLGGFSGGMKQRFGIAQALIGNRS